MSGAKGDHGHMGSSGPPGDHGYMGEVGPPGPPGLTIPGQANLRFGSIVCALFTFTYSIAIPAIHHRHI